ncbi:MAG: alpha/beta hydrolase [Parvibaculaceae bacterium]
MQFSVRASLEQFALPHPGGEGQLKISVATPAIVPPDVRVPVLYVVDGDLVFGMAAEIARALASAEGMPALYVVGIGYDVDYELFLKLRTADLSPPLGAEAQRKMGALGAMIGSDGNGGADAFLSFIVDRLMPEIAARYPQTQESDSFLFGHSLGGLFTAHVLMTRPEAFMAFIASSPSLWWDDFSIFRELPSFTERLRSLARPPRVFIDVGGKEQDPPQSVPPGAGITLEEAREQIRAARMIDATKEFADALVKAGVADLRHIAFAEEDHVSIVPGALLHGMRFALGHGR